MDDVLANLVARWRDGDEGAANHLFRNYADRLVALARSRLSDKFARRIDAEDVVQSAYRSFFSDVRAGRYEIEDGDDLWQLLVVITLHKLQNQVRKNVAGKRAVDRERGVGGDRGWEDVQDHVVRHEPSPVEALALFDELELLMRRLEPLHRQIIELRLQGHDTEAIAAQVQRTQRTVRRVLEGVRQLLCDPTPGHPQCPS